MAAIASHEATLRLLHDRALGSSVGAESAHVSVTIDPDGTIEIQGDGTGFIPSFWAHLDHELLFATSLASLVTLGLDATPDGAGVVEYLAMMHPLEDRTVLQGARLLPAGGRLTLGSHGTLALNVSRLYKPASDTMDDESAVARFRSIWSSILSDTIERGEHERQALSLSGGLDSRAIAAESVRQGSRPISFTYGGTDTYEGRVASEVSEALGLDHLFLRVTPGRTLREPERTALLLDGAHSAAELYDSWFAGHISTFADTVLNGHAGGPLWGDEKALGITGEQALVSLLQSRYAHELRHTSRFLAPELREQAPKLLRAGLASSLQEWEADERPDAVTFWNVHNRQFRWGNMMPNIMRRQGIRTEAPFLDSRFLRFSARLTPEQRRNGNLYLRVQREVFPETARIARSDDANAPANLNHVYWSGESSFASQLLGLARSHPISAGRRAVRRARLVGGSAVRRHTPWQSFDDGLERRRTPFPAADWLRSMPEYGSRLADFLDVGSDLWPIDQNAVEEAIGCLRRGDTPTSSPLVLAKVATLQTWLGEFRRRAAARDRAR